MVLAREHASTQQRLKLVPSYLNLLGAEINFAPGACFRKVSLVHVVLNNTYHQTNKKTSKYQGENRKTVCVV